MAHGSLVATAGDDDQTKGTTMNDASKALAQFKKANKLIQLSFRKNGPKSFKRGQGRLLNALFADGGTLNRDDLIWIMGCDRSELKGVVKKAVRNGYVRMDNDAAHAYTVTLTDEGRTLAAKRAAANDRAATEIASCLSEEEVAQLNAITEKIILSCKAKGISGKKRGRKPHGGVDRRLA